MEPHIVQEENANLIHSWLCERGGILIWNSQNIANLGASWTGPYLDKDGNVSTKPNWQADASPSRHITSIDDIVVSIPKEYKRFYVAVKQSSNGFSLKVTSGGSRRIEKEVAKAEEKTGKPAWYIFDYFDEKNCVIMVDDCIVPLEDWMEKNHESKQINH